MSALHGKVVLITGGSSGIGRATGERLASMGCHVALLGRNREALDDAVRAVETHGVQGLATPADVTDSEQVKAAVDATVAKFGRLDILVCSAGLSMRAYFERSKLDACEQVMRVNFFGSMYATWHAIPHVKKTHGSLVAVSSLTGKRGIPSYALYGASKFAVTGLYEALRVELRRDKVHVGVVSPAFVDTPLRTNVLGPDGKPWETPPAPPFRVWPVRKCVDRIIRLIVGRKREALLPGFAGMLLGFDKLTNGFVGDRMLARRFPPEKS
ncbi:MAG: SDR family oxidoreductase [Gemmataceae bacterium]|nr:SDR family oxidoreductase [Gemmataceae bacterium]